MIQFLAGAIAALVVAYLIAGLDWDEVRTRLFGVRDPRDCKGCKTSWPVCATGRTPRGADCCGDCMHFIRRDGEDYFAWARRMRVAHPRDIWGRPA